jgi:hypothetical protein
MTTLLDRIKSVRRVSTPLIGITTADQAATIATLTKVLNGKAPALCWDLVHGLQGLNEAGQDALDLLLGGQDPEAMTANPVEALRLAEKFPQAACLLVMNAHRYVDNEGVSQALLNLRDPFKSNFRTCVLLAPVLRLPVELEQDVIVFDEPLPDDAALGRIVVEIHEAAGLGSLDATVEQAVAALRGLSSFTAEQIVAMSLRKDGLDLDSLWERKRAGVAQTKGLTVETGTETFADIGGLAQIKQFSEELFTGGNPPRVIVRLEEIEKVMAGAQGDTSGVSQDALQAILTEMEDQNYAGLIAVGPPGSGKSLYSKALGNTYGILSLAIDLGAMRGSLVGQSEEAVRAALKMIRAIGGRGGAFWVATSNKLDVVPPELRRRFRYGIWCWDLPDAEERAAIWQLNLRRYELPYAIADVPADEDWTGSDIRNVCELAWRLKISLANAATYILPVAKSDPEGIDRLRRTANGRFLSASSPGPYRHERTDTAPVRRSLSV